MKQQHEQQQNKRLLASGEVAPNEATTAHDEMTKPIWAEEPPLATILEERRLAEEAAKAVVEPPPPPSDESQIELSPKAQELLQHLVLQRSLNITEICSILNCTTEEAYDIAITLVEKNLARFERYENERYLIATIRDLSELQQGNLWTCAVCHARLRESEVAFGVCPRCGSTAFWLP